jgi:hypothetical protein
MGHTLNSFHNEQGLLGWHTGYEDLAFWDMTLCSMVDAINLSEEPTGHLYVASIYTRTIQYTVIYVCVRVYTHTVT